MICRQIFQIVSTKHLTVIQELFWFSAQFHLMIALQITRRSTHCETASDRPRIFRASTPHLLGGSLAASGIEPGPSGPKLDARASRLPTAGYIQC